MDVKGCSISSDLTVSPFLTSATVLSETASEKFLKIAELTEYCRVAEDYLNECKSKVEMLTFSKNESEKLRAEYLARNKISATNSESLIQVKNELYKYKCELKSNYITAQGALRSRQLKYEKLMASYESEWQIKLEQYNSNSIVLELVQIQEENILLEKEIDKLEKLKGVTEREFKEVMRNLVRNFIKGVIEFSQAMVDCSQCMDLEKRHKEEKNLAEMKSSLSTAFNFFRTEIPTLNLKNVIDDHKNIDPGCLSGIDFSVFDEMAIPSENLETQNDEELLPLFGDDPKPDENGDDKSQVESMSIDYQEPELESQIQHPAEGMARQSIKTSSEVSESQYFRPQEQQPNLETLEQWVNSDAVFVRSKKKEFDDNQQMGKLKQNEEQLPMEVQTAKDGFREGNEENLSDGSFENQYGFVNKNMDSIQQAPREYNENFEFNYDKPSSETSGELSQQGNETVGSLGHTYQDKTFLTKTEQTKGFTSFSGFFNMENEINSPKPSIFKLF